MKMLSAVSRNEGEYLAREYARIEYGAGPLQRFMDEIYATLRACGIGAGHSVLDVGCGRGYFLRYLAEKGFTDLRGVDPCEELVRERVSEAVGPGAYFDPTVQDKSFDVAITCHTLHHLTNADPVEEVRWLGRVARRLVVVVEINNTNLPMLLMSLLHRKVEANAFRYNLGKASGLCQRAGMSVVQAGLMDCGYISGDSALHRFAAAVGTKPYNIVAARP